MQTITTIGLDIAKSVFPGITVRVLIASTCMPPSSRPSGMARRANVCRVAHPVQVGEARDPRRRCPGNSATPYASGSREANVVGTAIATTSSTAGSMSSNAGRSAIRHDARGIAFATRAVSCAPAPSEGFQVIT